jgi:hypothetical protein
VAVLAWLVPVPVFVVVTLLSWGFTQAAFLAWSILALPLAVATHQWLKRIGRPARPRDMRQAAVWLGLVLLADIPLFVFWQSFENSAGVASVIYYWTLEVTCVACPVGITGVALREILRRKRAPTS